MRITNISEAKVSLSYLIKMAQQTKEPVIIDKAGVPVAILSAFHEATQPRELGGSWEGKVKFSGDFNSSNEEITDDFYNST